MRCRPGTSSNTAFRPLWNGGILKLDHLHPWAERQALEMRLKGSKHALNFFRVALLHRYLHIGSSTRNILETLSGILPDSQKWHDSLDRKWTRPLNVGAARAMLTREDSEWSWKFEEPWQSRPRDWRGVGQFFLQGRVKGLAKSLQRGRVEMLLLGQAQWPCTCICICVFSSAMRIQMQEASPVVTLNWSAGWKTRQELQQTLHNVDLCRESAMWRRRPSLTDLVI